MSERDIPRKQGMTPAGYDEYGGGPNRDNSPEKMYEREAEKNEKQEHPSEHSSGDRRRVDRRRSGGRGAQG